MIPRLVLLGLLLALSLALLVTVPPASAEDQDCDHLISLPGTRTTTFTISVPGIYCLDTDVIMAASFTSGHAIEIAANYVTLNLRGHKVHGANAGTGTTAAGIFALNRRNVTVKNGTVWGFGAGVLLDSVSLSGYLVEGIRAELNREIGIMVTGANSIVRHNVVANTGPTTRAGDHVGLGIYFVSTGGRVLENDVLTATPKGLGLGAGISIQSADDVLVVGNRVTNAAFGVHFNSATGKYRDNLTSNVGTPFLGGTDAGNNN